MGDYFAAKCGLPVKAPHSYASSRENNRATSPSRIDKPTVLNPITFFLPSVCSAYSAGIHSRIEVSDSGSCRIIRGSKATFLG